MAGERDIDNLRRIASDDQFITERREARMLAQCLGADVAAYHASLRAGGIGGELLDELVMHFAERWIGPVTDDATITVNVEGMDE